MKKIYDAIEVLIKNEVVDYQEARHILTCARRKDVLESYEYEDLVEQAKKMDSYEGW